MQVPDQFGPALAQRPPRPPPRTLDPPTRTPVPHLVRISAGRHPNDSGEYGFERISFTFTTGFPSHGFGMSIDIPHSNPEYLIRVTEVETVSLAGAHSYVVAFDVLLGLVARH